MTFLQLTDLHKSYGPVSAVAGVGFDVPAGSRTAIVGPSGSGKTTLLRVIAGFEKPEAGRVRLGEKPLVDEAVFVPGHLRGIGLVAQEGALFPHLTIAENIGFGLADTGPARAVRICELLDMVGLERPMLIRKPDQLSGGQQQRVALARALARKPRLMLLDEPFSALDTGLRAATRKAITQVLEDAGIATILVTHDQAEALAFADQLGVMRGGRLIQIGTPRDIYLKPVDAMTALFLGEAIILPAVVAGGHADCALGRMEVDDPNRSGAVEIMLRPEQLLVQRLAADRILEQPPAAIVGRVETAEFSGATYDLSVRLQAAGQIAPGVSFRLSVSSRDVFAVGEHLHIVPQGPAHILKAT